ncbi:ArsB/NhaD family transporter [Micromonospora sp. KC723]|uniref:ArsB/NhaD family transporter n=1 Tax=Micromonospora sp. KC723 TaxID=2530381 RepID=UPI0010437868|nr:ArsB/NhaD family transporter [Micromonospora sp. KC723]TDB76775.1 arsenic transporter [Micromonospora sp. KC723]
MNTAVGLLVLAGVLGFAVARPRGLPEAAAALPGAAVVVAAGLVPWHEVRAEVAALAPTVGFLAAVLVLAHLADEHGVFAYAGTLVGAASRGSPQRLLRLVFVLASVVTAVLSLDATVVLLTPIVLATATGIGVRPKPHLYACGHLANTGSLLLPVSNLTNLLAFTASGLGFTRFAALMVLPWLAVITVEYVIFRRMFALDLTATAPPLTPARRSAHPPWYAIGVLVVTLAGFALAEPVGVHPAWVAAVGAAALAVPRLARKPLGEAGRLVRAANLPFCAFVFGLGVVVQAVRSGPVGDLVDHLVPGDTGLLGLLAAALLAAVLANLVNNLPATLMLVPLVAHSPGLVLAVLIGVNIGPNLTYVGSLATLLWRQVLHTRDHSPGIGEFLRLGIVTVPACLLVGVGTLWASLHLVGLP